jgi:hypothetical protein
MSWPAQEKDHATHFAKSGGSTFADRGGGAAADAVGLASNGRSIFSSVAIFWTIAATLIGRKTCSTIWTTCWTTSFDHRVAITGESALSVVAVLWDRGPSRSMRGGAFKMTDWKVGPTRHYQNDRLDSRFHMKLHFGDGLLMVVAG